MTAANVRRRAAAAAPQVGVLDVASSVLGRRWELAAVDERLAEAISQSFDLPVLAGRLLAARGVGMDAVETFLNPSLRVQLPDPSSLTDMDTAAERIARAIQTGEGIGIFGDYDVDGATSAALLHRFLSACGAAAQVYIPDRLKEGYGPNIGALRQLRANGAAVVITVDCGTTAFDALAKGRALGLDILVLDHHRAEPRLPEAYALVNPNRLDDSSGQGHLAAVGVTFLTVVAVNRQLRAAGFYTDARPEPRILDWLDLVALGTICDVVPLTGVNRAFAAQGLRVMTLRQNRGLAALADIAGVNDAPTAFHAGFILGPRVNAGGRLGEASLGARLLSTDDPIAARSIAAQLHDYNAQRKAVEADVLDEALAQAEKIPTEAPLTVVAGTGWHPGVIGIVAARLKEKYNRPACVVTWDENGVGKASGRSVAGIDLGAAVAAAKGAELLIDGGGHAMAVGFTVTENKLKALTAHLSAHVERQRGGAADGPELRIDAVISAAGLTEALAAAVEKLAPYGAGNAEPRFALMEAKIIRPRVVKDHHVSCFIQDTAGGASVKGIAFRAMDSKLGEALLTASGAPMHLAGHISVNSWNGKTTVDFQITDAARIRD